MNYLLKNKPKRSANYNYIIVGVVFALLLGLSFLAPNSISTSSHYLLKPFWFLRDKTTSSFHYIVNYIKFQNLLVRENTSLKEELEILRLYKIDYEFLLKESEKLNQEILNNEEGMVISEVLSKPPQSPFDTFILNSGTNHGVSVGNKVYLSRNIILGTIVKATGNTSIMRLFSAGSEVTEATLQRTGVNFDLKGVGGANFRIEVPKDTDIIWGDTFIFPGRSSILATVSFIDSSSQSSFKTVYLKIPDNVLDVNRVFIQK